MNYLQFDFDIDDDGKPSWLDTHHKAIQQQLALHSFTSIYAPRRPGRGHLIIPFASPVDAEIAYRALVRARLSF